MAAGDDAPVQPAKIVVSDQAMAISPTGAASVPAKPDEQIVVSSIRPAPPVNAVAPAAPNIPVALAQARPPDPPQGATLSAVLDRVLTDSIKPDAEAASKNKPQAIPLPPSKPPALALATNTALEKGADATGSVKPTTTKGDTTRAKPSQASANIADASSYLVQLASSPSKSEALATLSRLRKQFPDVLRGGSVHRADQGSTGMSYRVQVGPLSRDAAVKVCAQLKSSGASCTVTHT